MSIFNMNKGKAKAINELNKYLNEVAPLVIARLSEGFRLNTSGQLFKKDDEAIKAILADRPSKQIRIYLDVGQFSMYLRIDTNFQADKARDDGGYTCAYYKDYAYVYDVQNSEPKGYEPRKMVIPAQLDKAESDIEKYKEYISQYESKIYRCKELLGW